MSSRLLIFVVDIWLVNSFMCESDTISFTFSSFRTETSVDVKIFYANCHSRGLQSKPDVVFSEELHWIVNWRVCFDMEKFIRKVDSNSLCDTFSYRQRLFFIWKATIIIRVHFSSLFIQRSYVAYKLLLFTIHQAFKHKKKRVSISACFSVLKSLLFWCEIR